MLSNVNNRLIGWTLFGASFSVLFLLGLSCFSLARVDFGGPVERESERTTSERDSLLAENRKLTAERDALLAENSRATNDLYFERLNTADLVEQLDESEKSYTDLLDKHERLNKDRLAAADQLSESEAQRIALRAELSNWQDSYDKIRHDFNRYRRKRESGIDGFFYNTIGW